MGSLLSARSWCALVLVVTLGALGCGSSTTAVRVGERSLDRGGLMAWVSDRTGANTAVAVSSGPVGETIQEWILNESLNDLLAEYGWSPDENALKSARDQLLAAGLDPEDPRLPTYIGWQAVRARIASGGPEVRAAYEAYAALLQYELCASHILVESEPAALEILDLVQSGSEFEDLARGLSQDPGSATQGGKLGCVPIGSFVPTFERAVLGALKAREAVVGPVPSQFGFHVIRIDERRTTEPMGFDNLGDRRFGTVLQIATLTRSVEIDNRYGTWDPVVGRVVAPNPSR